MQFRVYFLPRAAPTDTVSPATLIYSYLYQKYLSSQLKKSSERVATRVAIILSKTPLTYRVSRDTGHQKNLAKSQALINWKPEYFLNT